jgi:Protein of unknown function (DUF3179)
MFSKAMQYTISRGFWWTFFLSVLASGAVFFIPAYIIRPFSYQSPKGLWWAMAIRQHAPLWSFLGAGLTLLLAWILWYATDRRGKLLIVAGVLFATAAAVLSRQNYFEWMFHPVSQAGFEAASQTKLDNGEMVLTLSFNNDARAYPIREMAYHHILNDVVGGVPVAVTY